MKVFRYIIFSLTFLVFPSHFFAQKDTDKDPKNEKDIAQAENDTDTLIKRLQVFEGFDFPKNYDRQYRLLLNKVKKVYPLAVRAAEIIDSLDAELEGANRKSKQRKIARQTKKGLKEDFKFILKDMYISEGQILTKLIYRETGMTVKEIITKYKNGLEASLYLNAAKLFEQDLDAVYYPNTEDFVIECIIHDLETEKVPYNPEFKTISREEFKEIKREEKARSKERKKLRREKKKRERKEKRNSK